MRVAARTRAAHAHHRPRRRAPDGVLASPPDVHVPTAARRLVGCWSSATTSSTRSSRTPAGPPGRGVRVIAGPRAERPSGSGSVHAAMTERGRAVAPTVLTAGVRSSSAHDLRLRLASTCGAARHGRPRRGAGGHLPLAHRDRGLPVAHSTSRYVRPEPATRALRAGLHPRAGRPSEFRSFRIVDGVVTEEDINVVESYAVESLHVRAHRRGRRARQLADASSRPTQRRAGADAWPSTVSIPTILRTHTGGEKSVEAKGATVAEVIDDLDARHRGHHDRLINDGQAAPLRQHLRQRRGRPLRRWSGGPGRRGLRSRSCRPSPGRLTAPSPVDARPRRPSPAAEGPAWPATTRCWTRSATRRWSGCRRCRPSPDGAAVGQAGGPQPDRLDQGPARAGDGASAPRPTGRSQPGCTCSSPPPATPASRWPWPASSRATG